MPERSLASPRVTKLGRYEVLNELGKGAMGIVYLAKDPVIGRMVAIKTIRLGTVSDDDSESSEFRERFIREAQTAGILSHNNIVTIHDIGEDAESQTSFIAMEYIEGKNLKTLMAEKTRFPYDQVADMIAQVAEAIDYAHRKGIIHRDVKPANIIITADGKVKITDFGIAKIASSNLTTTGQFLGTPNYMSPEQVSGAPVDGRSDIFSLGVVLYELLTKRKPFQGENLTAISYKIVHEEFTPPATLSSDVPPEFNSIVARAMAKDPWNRYQRGKDFALALHQLRAVLEEQKALQELGGLVSAAENLPTMRLANMDQLLAEAAAEAAAQAQAQEPRRPSSELLPPLPEPPGGDTVPPFPVSSDSSASRRAAASSPPLTEDALPQPPGAPPPPPEIPADIAATRRFVMPLMAEVEKAAPPAASLPPPPPPPSPMEVPTVRIEAPPPPVAPRFARAVPLRVKALVGPRLDLMAELRPWVKERWEKARVMGGREVNPRWFWTVSLSAAALFVVFLGLLAFRAASLGSGRATQSTARLKQQTEEKKRALEDGRKLLTAGRYEESLALFRKVLVRNPNNQQARLYAQMAENALAGRVEEAARHAEAESRMQSAQEAFDAGNFEEAVRLADEVLQLDGGRIEAQSLREEASMKLAEARAEAAAAAAAAKKKAARPREQVARRTSARPESRPTAVSAPASQGASEPAASSTSLRLLFDSPVSEGHIMVAVNSEVLLRRNFSFKRKAGLFKTIEGTGTVSAMIPVKPGSMAVRAWLSGPDIRGSVVAHGNAKLLAGETRTVRLEYSGGNLSMRIQ